MLKHHDYRFDHMVWPKLVGIWETFHGFEDESIFNQCVLPTMTFGAETWQQPNS